ncbi:MAG: nicotinate-nucleotide adenylyltransferase [Clostridiales bacterium]|jgi:nicotinate-nucleotide adenylyltransferase|nr:nicotinate-nucleotide adenylyltransferase [Clostridiales bacterium]
MQRIGIMGGSFDPIHFGHLWAAQQVLESHYLDMVIFMPAGRPVLKLDRELAPPEDRYNMCVLACSGNENFFVSRIEIDRRDVTYTIDTMKELHKQYPEAEFFFILGSDAMASFPKWRDSAQILELCSLVEISRSKLDISSTEIRGKLAFGKSVNYLLPDLVVRYIDKLGLYCHLPSRLRKELSRPRFLHSLAVMDEAVKLGEHYELSGEMLEKVRIAGLLHDCAKNLCDELSFEEMAKICDLDEFFRGAPALAHCYVGAELAKEDYGIDDPEILSAISAHTFGDVNMSQLDKIVYLADFIEPTRPPDPAREAARALAYENLDKAMIYVLNLSIERNLALGRAVYKKSFEAKEYLEEKYGKHSKP